MPSALRILFIASAYPRFEGDIITPWLGATIARLREVNVDVEVLAPSYHGAASNVMDGVRIHRFRYAPSSWEMLSHDNPIPWQLNERPIRLALVPGYVAAAALGATRLARSTRFDAIHAFWPVPHAIPGMIARRLTGIPLVSTFFGAELHWVAAKHTWARPVVRAIVRASDVVTAISSFTARELAAIAPEARPVIVPFGAAIADASLQTTSVPAPFSSERAEFLFVGRLVARKGVDVLLRAMAELNDPRAVLTIVGAGAERAVLEALADSLSLRERVTFTGFVPQRDLERRLMWCDALVLPALPNDVAGTEGLGVALIEALQFARPVIASDSGGIPDVVVHEHTGLLVPAGDARALAAAMRRLMDDPALARTLGEQGRAHVRANFSWSGIVCALRGVYDDAIARRRT